VSVWVIYQFGNFKLAVNPMILRILRLSRLMRLVRLMKSIELFDCLHLIAGAIRGCSAVFGWSCVIFFLLLSACALCLCYSTIDYINDESSDHDTRTLFFDYFGTYSRAFFTMFEITFAGSWVTTCRFLQNHVSEWYMPLFVVYRAVVGFAVLKVITGIFLYETFKVSQSDDNIMILQRQREVQKHAKKMRLLMAEVDHSGDGHITLEEFKHMVHVPDIKHWLQAQDIHVRDAELVFALVDDSADGQITVEELVAGFAKLKGGATSVDMFTVLNNTGKLLKSFEDLESRLQHVFDEIDPVLVPVVAKASFLR